MFKCAAKLKWAVPIFCALAFFGALFWAKSDDPFRRVEFTLKTPDYGKVKGIVVLPKPIHSCPVVVFLHGSGGSLMTSGNQLRQLAELGMASVCLEYNQTNQAAFDEQFLALSQFVNNQPWAMTNAVAWVGFSLGAQRTLGFALRYPDIQPQLLVRMSGGWVPELDAPSAIGHSSVSFPANAPAGKDKLPLTPTLSPFVPQGAREEISAPVSSGGLYLNLDSGHSLRCPVLIVHAERDETFPVKDARRLGELLRTNGVSVTEKILPDVGHAYDPDRALVTRLMAEYCKSALTPSQPFAGAVERWIIPFWIWMIPAFAWASFCLYRWRKSQRELSQEPQAPLNRWEIGLRWLAAILAVWASAETGLHLITPHLATSEKTLAIARKYLVAPKMMTDFETLSANPIWEAKPVKTLLEHVELANYNRNELINWKVDDRIYNEFVLSPIIDAVSSGELNWRRPLWENFYPRIRKENSPEAAAEIVVRFLRERVTITAHLNSPQPGVESIWKHQITDEKGFEIIYVAALRSVSVGARLNVAGQAELWTGEKWQNAPRPLASSFL